MRERLLAGLLFAFATTLTSDAQADIRFGPQDIATVFFVTKSIDRNRVDYGIHLTDHCAPVNDDAVFLYWRDADSTPVIHALGIFDYIPYGLAEQRLVHRTLTGGEQFMRLKQLNRPVLVTTKKEPDGRRSAVAHMRIANVEGAILTSIYAKVSGAVSVAYIDIHGKDPRSGVDLVERVFR
jgi:hypothetical protein